MDIKCGATHVPGDNACKTFDRGSLRAVRDSETEKFEGPPDGFYFVIPYLDLRSRLTLETVSKSLREAVKDNPLIWEHLIIEPPASTKLTNDALLAFTKRADGRLKFLRLVDCPGITESTLKQVFDENPRLLLVFVPRCTGLDSDALLKFARELFLRRARHQGGGNEAHLDVLLRILQS